jgi:uncharacterized membrane protein
MLGILSLGLLLLTFLLAVWIKFSDYDEFRKLALVGWVVISFLGSLILGIPGCIIALIALRRNKAEGDDPSIKRIAVVGLVLGGLGIVTILILFAYALVFAPSIPPPDMQTPLPSTAIP